MYIDIKWTGVVVSQRNITCRKIYLVQ